MLFQKSVIIFIVHQNQLLLQYNPKWGDFSFIGGKLELEELPLEAACREVEEELTIQRQVDFELIEFSPNFFEIEKFSQRTETLTHYIFYLFYLKAKTNFLPKINPKQNIWISLDDKNYFQKNNISEIAKSILEKVNIVNLDSFQSVIN